MSHSVGFGNCHQMINAMSSMMERIRTAGVGIAIVLGVTTGCHGRSVNVVGTWTGGYTPPPGQIQEKASNSILRLMPDGAFAETKVLPNLSPISDYSEGTWAVSGDSLTLTTSKSMGRPMSDYNVAPRPEVFVISSDGATLTKRRSDSTPVAGWLMTKGPDREPSANLAGTWKLWVPADSGLSPATADQITLDLRADGSFAFTGPINGTWKVAAGRLILTPDTAAGKDAGNDKKPTDFIISPDQRSLTTESGVTLCLIKSTVP